MTQKEIIHKIVDLLTNELKTFDFKPSYKEQGFIRKTENAMFFFNFLFTIELSLKRGQKVFW